ncbi:MAG: hypothetical protein H6625_12635 [Bdellovibrionaceae bacterium]|nr:hypothetical protein [Pseudobdellovibrionaceae bacterium]
MPDKIIFKIFIYWLLSSLVLLVGVYSFWDLNDALSCMAGEILVGFNLLALIWAWQRIFERKGLALAVGVIVFKYAILITSIYFLIAYQKVSAFGFLMGCGVLIFVMAMIAFDYKKQNIS